MTCEIDNTSIADIVGPWVDPDFESSLIKRCRNAWSKPIRTLTNQELATFLRQHIAVAHVLPIAKKRLEDNVDDETEIYDGELETAVEEANKTPTPP